MKRFVEVQCRTNITEYNRLDHILVNVPDKLELFAEHTAKFFIEKWMEYRSQDMQQLIKEWDNCNNNELKESYKAHFEGILLTQGNLFDEPSSGKTGPIATFAETMLRWCRESFAPNQLLVEPPVPKPPSEGHIDLMEITGTSGDYDSMKITLWEVKGSDNQIHEHNKKVYRQLDDYPRRLFLMANSLGHDAEEMIKNHNKPDMALIKFLKDVGDIVRNRSKQSQYGVFLVYDANIKQNKNSVPGLHKHPPNSPEPQSTHFLYTLMIPDFKQMRLNIWRLLRLM